MTTVPVTIAKDNAFQNLVVKDRSMFEFGTFQQKVSRLFDAESAVIQTLNVTNLNQANGVVGNPFVTPLTPNEIVALTATRSLTTVPYSSGDVAGSLIQRSATNGVVARFLGAPQIVLGTAPATTTLAGAQNGYVGGVGFGSGIAAATLVLSGGSSVINSSAAANNIVIDDSSTLGGMTIQTLVESSLGEEATYLFAKGDLAVWQTTLVDLPGLMGRFELRRAGASAVMVVNIGSPTDTIEFLDNIIPATAMTYDLGSTTQAYNAIYLTTESITGIGATATYASAPATGLGTTVSLTTGAQAAETISFLNAALLPSSPIMMSVNAYSGTQGIPVVIFDRALSEYYIYNAGDGLTAPAGSPLNGTVTTSFGILNSNGNGP